MHYGTIPPFQCCQLYVRLTASVAGDSDDRWVFTEDNPARELMTAAHLACISRALADFNPELSREALDVSTHLMLHTRLTDDLPVRTARLHAAAELLLTTGENRYSDILMSETDLISENMKRLGSIAARVADRLPPSFTAAIYPALRAWRAELDSLSSETPYGVPYRPHIWGAGWMIQQMGCEHYFLTRAFPDLFPPELTCRALDFVLGCHPGNSVSFASGVGASSVTTAYGFNRADASYIPGGVVSGTALIKPDFPELKQWPYLWQQTEYVLGGGSSRFLFLVLAVQDLLKQL